MPGCWGALVWCPSIQVPPAGVEGGGWGTVWAQSQTGLKCPCRLGALQQTLPDVQKNDMMAVCARVTSASTALPPLVQVHRVSDALAPLLHSLFLPRTASISSRTSGGALGRPDSPLVMSTPRQDSVSELKYPQCRVDHHRATVLLGLKISPRCQKLSKFHWALKPAALSLSTCNMRRVETVCSHC